MLLENTEIRLRALEPEDLDILYRWENDTKMWMYGSAISPYSKLVLRQYINDSLEMGIFQSKQLRLMITLVDTDVTIGTVDVYDINMRNKHAGIGILIDDQFRNKNYALSTLNLMSEYAFCFLKLHQIYAYVGENNTPSLRLFEKAGYQTSGMLKDWVIAIDEKEYENVRLMQLINHNTSNIDE